VKDQFLEFEIQVSEDAAAWDRARFILTKYGKAMAGQNRLMTSTDSVLEYRLGRTTSIMARPALISPALSTG
jgi:hypothetical protein